MEQYLKDKLEQLQEHSPTPFAFKTIKVHFHFQQF